MMGKRKIIRTKENKYGWRWKFDCLSDGSIKIVRESKNFTPNLAYFKAIKELHIWGEGIVELKKIILRELFEKHEYENQEKEEIDLYREMVNLYGKVDV